MKPNIRQIAAATALAEMSPKELAEDIGLDPALLDRILKHEANPTPEMIDRLQIALEARQIEFGPRSSVALKDEYFRRLTGDVVFLRLLDEILRTMMGRTDDVLFFHVEPSMWVPLELDAEQRLWDAGIKCRYICPDDSTVFNAPKEAYRIVPRLYKTHELQIVYSEYVAIVGDNHENDGIIILNSESAAAAERGKFDFVWNHARKPD